MQGRNHLIANSWLHYARIEAPRQAGLDHHDMATPRPAPPIVDAELLSQADADAREIAEFQRHIRQHPALEPTPGGTR